MNTKSSVFALAACLFLFNFCVSPAAYAARIDLVVNHGVEKDAEAQTRLAINSTLEFFQKTYGIGLQRDIRIVVVPDKMNYKQAIQRWFGVSDAMALRQVENSAGLSLGPTITVNMGSIHHSQDQLFCLCHEIVHHYQSQESRDRTGSIRWMAEGVANAIAAQILQTAGLKGAVDCQKLWLETVKQVPDFPRLENLRHFRGWSAATHAYGPNVTYGTASLAVLTLIQWRGYKPLFTYFQALKTASPEDAFYLAFGTKLSDFEKQFRPF